MQQKMKRSIVLVVVLLLAGCDLFFAPGYPCTDKNYFAAPPIIVKTNEHYVLQWHYGSMGFFFSPQYKVKEDALWFSLRATSSSGQLAGKEAEMVIKGQKEIEALEKGGAFWWSHDSLTPLVVCAMICANTIRADQASEYELAFYMLNSEEELLTPQTPQLITKTFSEINNLIIADYDPNLSVETKESFFKSTFLSVLNHKDITPQGKEEMNAVKKWIDASPKKFVGFQLIKQ